MNGITRRWAFARMLASGVRARKFSVLAAVRVWRQCEFRDPGSTS